MLNYACNVIKRHYNRYFPPSTVYCLLYCTVIWISDPAAMMDRLAMDPSASVASVLEQDDIPQLNEDTSTLSGPPAPTQSVAVVSKSRPYGPTPMRGTGVGQPPSSIDSPQIQPTVHHNTGGDGNTQNTECKANISLL